MLASWQLARKDDGESSEALTVPDAGVELGPDVTSLTVTVHESLVPTTTEDDAQLMKLAVDCTFTVKVKVPGVPALWSVSPA